MIIKSPITRATWRIYAPEDDMSAAEYAVLGAYDNHMSRLDWEPFDEDDEKPKNCERVIDLYLPNPDRMADAFKVLAFLGAKARVSVSIMTEHFAVDIDTNGFSYDSNVFADGVTGELAERMKRIRELAR